MTEPGATATDTDVSSFVIVPVAAAGLATVYPVPIVAVMTTVSSGSTVVSLMGSTITTAVVPPDPHDTEPVPVPGLKATATPVCRE